MKNPFKFIKHIVKDPITTFAEADTRKKEIMPLLYGSIGVMVVSVVLQTVAKLDFMSIFSFIGLIGLGFCGFLLMVISKAKTKFQALTCDKCNAMVEIKTHEDFAKYVSYIVEKDEAKFRGYTGNKKPTDGIYSQVKFSGYASAILSVTLTCPHCGAVKALRFSAEPFKCYAEATRVGALNFGAVSTSLQNAVKTAVSDYNDPNKKETIPYTFHSSKNPNFENRYSFSGANGGGARPNYLGAIIEYHKDVEEILEHYFVFNELTGSLIDPNAASKKNTVSKSANSSIKTDSDKATEQTVLSDTEALSKEKMVACEPEKAEVSSVASSVVSTGETPSKELVERVDNVNQEKNHQHKRAKKSVIIIAAICAILVVGGVILGSGLANRNKGGNDVGANVDTDSSSQQSVAETTSNTIDKINVNDYVGYWRIKESQEKELTIHSGSGESVDFSLWYSKNNELNSISAQLTDNVATFSVAVDGAVVKGQLTFQKHEIIVSITQSTLEEVPVEELRFTELHMSSLVPKQEEQSDVDDEDQDTSSVASTPSIDYDEESKPSLSEIPYLFQAEENTYQIYKDPSYNSDYVKMLPKGTFTIVEEEYDENNNLWGKLKSGVGWICVAENTEK